MNSQPSRGVGVREVKGKALEVISGSWFEA